jgi:mono/diheme cytochrome c family protein
MKYYSYTLLLLSLAVTGAQSQVPSSPTQRILNASPYAIAADTELESFVEITAEEAISEHCASCHGADLSGEPGVPNLTDFDWLWGIVRRQPPWYQMT